ncbi:serine protease grass-like [Drosophila ficusphila]|uniref:serine protease grass-like n=1 Tax=Drosophila ficusphila TaxID=30025 RepID=UPI0007E67CF4|nr:serine protease grass-like [Drosophila ficusphila]
MTDMQSLLLAFCLIVGLKLGLADISGNGTERPYPTYCTTFEEKPGKCIHYKKCPYIAEVITRLKAKKQLSERDHEIMANSLCSANNQKVVCCEEFNNDAGWELLKAYDPICGEFGDSKVTGGREIKMGSRPWMALLKYNITDVSQRTSFLCGGTLITSRYVLTAAHCIRPNLLSVRLGEHRISTEQDCDTYGSIETCLPPYQDVPVEKFIVHEGFHAFTLFYDIALLRLDRSVTITSFVKPICLPIYEEVKRSIWGNKNQHQKVTGWGITDNSLPSDVPKEADVIRKSLSECAPGRTLMDNQLCVSAFVQDSCQGDSGGPLLYSYLYQGQQRFVQTGIVSKGPKNCGTGSTAIYSDVTRFVPWITQNIEI